MITQNSSTLNWTNNVQQSLNTATYITYGYYNECTNHYSRFTNNDIFQSYNPLKKVQ